MRKKLLWTFPDRRMSTAAAFPSEWVIPRAEIVPPLGVLRDSDIWLAAEKNGRVFLRGHVRVAKIARCVDDIREDSILLVADRAASFRVSRKCAPRWRMETPDIRRQIAEIPPDVIGEISSMLAANSKFALAKKRVKIAVPASVWSGEKPALIAADAYAHALRSVELGGAFRLSSDRALTPFGAAILNSFPANAEFPASVEKGIRALDAEVDKILRADKPSAPRQSAPRRRKSGAAPMVDTVLLPLDMTRIAARVFLQSDGDFKRESAGKTGDAEARHQEILRQSAERIAALGFSPLWSESVDLAVRTDAGLRLFEIKSATKESFQSQMRRGLIQALEYQAAFKKSGYSDVRPALIIDNAGAAAEKRHFKEFGNHIGVAVFYHDDQIPPAGLETFIRAAAARDS